MSLVSWDIGAKERVHYFEKGSRLPVVSGGDSETFDGYPHMGTYMVSKGPIQGKADTTVISVKGEYELYNDIAVVKRVEIDRMLWLGPVIRMDENVPARKVFVNKLDRRRRRGQD